MTDDDIRLEFAACIANRIMSTIGPRGPQSLSNEMWVLGQRLIRGALLAVSSSPQQPTEPGDLDRPVASSCGPNK